MTLRHLLFVSVDMSKFNYIRLILLDPRVKINDICYCSLLPSQQLLSVVQQVSVKFRNSALNVQVTLAHYFFDINISHVVVAMHLRCGGIFNKITVLLQIS